MEDTKQYILDKKYLKDKISNIVNKAHKHPQKKEVREHFDRLNFACPICGDSEKIISRKRGNLYFKNLMYKCFNCGHHTSFVKLCETFDVDIDIEKRLEMYDYIDNNTYYKKGDDDFIITKLDKLLNLDEVADFYNTHPDLKLTNIKPVQQGSIVYQYLFLNRNIKNDPNLYEGVYHFSDTWKEPVVIILNRHENLLLGMQLRNLKEEKKKRFYHIIEFSEIYNNIHFDKTLDEFEAIAYNKLSHFINVLNINFNEEVTIFEGYFDSIFFPNSIGVVGVNTDITFILNDESIKIRLFYDNDADGYKNSIKMLKKGYQVFLWKLLFRDILKHKTNKYEAQKRLDKIKDLNKLAIETKKPPYDLLKMEKYFSKDVFDIMYLDGKKEIINYL
jgi:predicted RNA-binding Zn-ribbon protein involved in translation (DUF1610 family)